MLRLLIFCAIQISFALAQLPTCQPSDFHYEYTACDSDGGRWRVQVPKPNACEGGAPRPPTRGQSCDFTCDKGHYLDIANDQECKKCPPGTYSLGDGVRFEDWSKVPTGFTASAESFSTYFSGHGDRTKEANCSANEFKPAGSYISAVPGECNSQLTYSTTLVSRGTVLFEYQFPSDSSSLFHFTVQNDQCEATFGSNEGHESQWPHQTEKGQWGKIHVSLKKGLNVFKWRVISTNSEKSATKDPVLIRKVEITGVGFTSECTKCRSGTYSSGGTESCTPCPDNYYSEYGAQTCSPCDITKQYSMRGATSCTTRPPCTKEDYYSVQLPCVKGKTQVSYQWIRPQICRTDLTSSVNLPPISAQVDCPPCNPGMHLSKDSSVCEFCLGGTYSDGTSHCQDCPASTSPDYQLHYHWWNTMPPNMTSDCFLSSDRDCEYNSSWIPMGDHLETHYGRDEDAYLLLIHRVSGFRTPESVDKKEVVGTVSFEFSAICSTKCAFVFLSESNGESVVQKAWEGTQEKTHFSYDITNSGPVSFSWAFQRSYTRDLNSYKISEIDTAKIYSISISNSKDGGAVGCKKCPKGMLNDRCIPCPAGHYIDTNTTSCEACPPNTIIRSSNAWGKEKCVACGQGLKASADGTKCITDCTFTDSSGRMYDFTSLNKVKFVQGSNLFTGSGTKYFHGFNISLCGGDKMVTCKQNVTTDENKSNLPNQLSAVVPVKGVVCRSTFIPSNDASKMLSTQPTSLGDYITKIGFNESLKEMYLQGGFDPTGSEKDINFYSQSEGSTDACPQGRSTIISLRCDLKMEGDGAILFPPNCVQGTCDGCKFHFIWKTIYACPKCTKKDFNKIVGECNDGSQLIHYTSASNCYGEIPTVETQKCSIKFPFIIKVVVPPVLAVGVILLICVIYCWQRNKSLEYKYMKLVHGNEPNYDGELPGVDSCALSDGEEEQFDSVQFKESRGSKFMNKLRGKRSKKDDENPFESASSEKIPLT